MLVGGVAAVLVVVVALASSRFLLNPPGGGMSNRTPPTAVVPAAANPTAVGRSGTSAAPSTIRVPTVTPSAPVASDFPTSTTVPPTPIPPATPTRMVVPSPTLAPAGVAMDGAWFVNFGTLHLRQAGTQIVGTFQNDFTNEPGTLEGALTGHTFRGTWSSAGASGSVEWAFDDTGTTFDGQATGAETHTWCGARSDQPFPDGCSYAGVWINRVTDQSDCPMTLQRINLSVRGSYCRGAVAGTITYTSDPVQTVLEGTWDVPGFPPGPFTFYLSGYDARQFQGNWRGEGIDEWCGWRADAEPPSPCLLP
jgi:hypothetical protein